MQDATLILGFDMETDVGSWIPFYEGLNHATPKLLDLLAGEGVKATFFFVGDAAGKHPDVVRDVQQPGTRSAAIPCTTRPSATRCSRSSAWPRFCRTRCAPASNWPPRVVGRVGVGLPAVAWSA